MRHNEEKLILKTVPGPSLHNLSCACWSSTTYYQPKVKSTPRLGVGQNTNHPGVIPHIFLTSAPILGWPDSWWVCPPSPPAILQPHKRLQHRRRSPWSWLPHTSPCSSGVPQAGPVQAGETGDSDQGGARPGHESVESPRLPGILAAWLLHVVTDWSIILSRGFTESCPHLHHPPRAHSLPSVWTPTRRWRLSVREPGTEWQPASAGRWLVFPLHHGLTFNIVRMRKIEKIQTLDQQTSCLKAENEELAGIANKLREQV